MTRKWIWILAGVLTAAVAVALYRPRPVSAHASLVAAAAEAAHRPLQARLIGFAYAPLPATTRGDDARRRIDDLDISAARVLAEGSRQPTHAHAIAHLLVGNADRAVAVLLELVRTAPSNALYWSDLAAARYEESGATANPLTLSKALAAADTAIRLNPRLGDAHFNRALILARLGLRPFAIAEVSTLAAIEPQSPWTREAREEIGTQVPPSRRTRWKVGLAEVERAALEKDAPVIARAVERFPAEARAWSESFYLYEWAQKHLARKPEESARALAIARALAEQLHAWRGERLAADAAALIERATQRDERTVANLARGHVAYTQGRWLVQDRKPAEAVQHFLEAERDLRTAGSPMALMSACYRAGALIDTHRLDEAERLLDELAAVVPAEYMALHARIEVERSRLFGRTARAFEALTSATRAIELYERLGETSESARVRVAAAAVLTHIGRAADAWRMRRRIFEEAGAGGDPALMEFILNASAGDAVVEREYDVARSLYDLEIAYADASPVLRFDALLWRSFVAARMDGLTGPAADQIRYLRDDATALLDDALRMDAEDKIRVVEAMALRDSKPQEAIKLLDETIRFRERHQATFRAEALFERSRAYARSGASGEAMRDLEEGLDLIAEQSARGETAPLRDAFFGTAADACRELFALQQMQRGTAMAFMTTDRCRSLSIDAAQASLIDDLRRSIPAGTVLIELATDDARTAIFAAHPGGLEEFTTASGARDIADWLATLRTSKERLQQQEALRKLSGALLAPAWRLVHQADTIVFVPDDATSGVPFAAMQTPESRYLIQTHRIVIAPSAAAYVEGRAAHSSNALSAAAIVGDPAFDPERFPHLQRLPRARAEAETIDDLYSDATLLTDRGATAARVARAIRENDLVHIAAHAVVAADDAWSSTLVLAPDRAGDEPGVMYLHEIAALKLTRRPLVVLAGCRTSALGGGRGSLRSFAAAFLAAGSRGVIASTNDVNDGYTEQLTLAFHRGLRSGQNPVDALRNAQLEMLRFNGDARDIGSWATFQFYGAD